MQGDPESGLVLRRAGEPIERVSIKRLDLSLIAAGDGTEVIHHRLVAGARWAIGPEAGWRAMECVVVLNGRLRWQSSGGDLVLGPGDSVTAHPIRQDAIFVAETTVDFLYICSQPVFHNYSTGVQEMMRMAEAVEQKDGYTAGHCDRILRLAMLVGKAMELPSGQLLALNYGSFLHDLGKVRVPESILGKPGALSPDEWKVMRMHTVYGREMLEPTSLRDCGTVLEQHHERWNGSGYPHGLRGREIALEAAIVAVVDSYDAMTSHRVYQRGRPKADALLEIERGRETLYHPEVVDTFLSLSDQID